MWAHNEKAAKSQEGVFPDTESAGTLTLDFPASRVAGNNVSCSDHPVYSILLQQPEQTKTLIELSAQ